MEWGFLIICLGISLIVGMGIGSAAILIKTNKQRELRDKALREILHYQWGTEDTNDALVVTRIAIKGLKGE